LEKRSSPIFIEIITHPLRLELSVTDFCMEPYWKTTVPLDLNEYREEGYGLYLIQKLTEHISYESLDGKGNKIKVLYKKNL
jgi:anti-sigma regulatory factor (Ser/Thr protein kinase)